MWLINVETRQLEEFFGLQIQRYAILSHTWVDGQEVTFQEMKSCNGQRPPPSLLQSKIGWQKIDWACRQAARDRLDYAWVDTCCIDKSSSAELSEAINSMFRWYERAAVCYVLLADLLAPPTAPAPEPEQQSRELIAPSHINFYDAEWRFCFTKATASIALAQITNISVDILERKRELSAVPVAQKMSWAASRRATRLEDVAYSLLGIFGINMPMLYGEEERAFSRLQAEIINSCPDHTIFAWTYSRSGPEDISATDPTCLLSGVMASSPRRFHGSRQAQVLGDSSLFDFSLANRGIKLRAQFGLYTGRGSGGCCLVLPVCRFSDGIYGILMRNMGGGRFVRQDASRLVRISPSETLHRLMLDPFLLTQLPASRTVSREAQSLILESRKRVLKIVMPPGMEMYRRWPWQQWDDPDTLFFGGEGSPEDIGWAALKMVVSPPAPFCGITGISDTVDFIFFDFGWSRGIELGSEPRYTIHRVYGAVGDRAMENMNDEAVRDGWNAYWVANRLVNSSTPESAVLVAGHFGQRTLLVVCTLRLSEDTGICAGPFWRIAFDWKVVDRDQVPPADNRGWKGINWGGIWKVPWDAED